MAHTPSPRSIWRRVVTLIAPLALTVAACPMISPALAAPPHRPDQSWSLAGQPGGDIPDSAVYLRYQGRVFGIEYVEGWLRTTTANGLTFHDKDSAVAVQVRPHVGGSLDAYVRTVDLPSLAHSPGFQRGALTHDTIGGYPALRLVYRGRSAPDDVTGKTTPVQADRYYVAGRRALAIITLSTPTGVDNVDGFRRIAHSFRFR